MEVNYKNLSQELDRKQLRIQSLQSHIESLQKYGRSGMNESKSLSEMASNAGKVESGEQVTNLLKENQLLKTNLEHYEN